MLTSLLTAKAVVTAATAVVALGGAATAAYAGDLPAPAQKLAHAAIGAPSPKASHSAPAGPDATGPAAFGLCNAYSHAKAHGSARQKAVAFRHLAAAAGGADNIGAYCAAVPHPGRSHSGQPGSGRAGSAHSHPAGQPSSLPATHSSGHSSSAPITHPTGKPTAVPTPK